ncbi:AarF/UbiB family protein [Shewanella sp. 1_MG-2023]|uniref:AarF/UbiB family protein n=1 Tax=Shewanella electrodiphila TaxID=934143 RepID=A0ABT0KNR0_9GAMM|nr:MULTISPECIES: AarF/UbiB family protein [Shewanella]MCC4832483.1 AarF/ABC1/UbiB kinase family protein [Shewanella sp. 10N.7]MCL1045383.1 AarF/UbiB family protein [Shewanella electrodiphila]MDO6611337.1 AarF/UbiB family protein [Shewanella sp. 7_MG-2023]MDO6771192.1 AarF/UbiB family protein [Shewanella sp. 2_MG-2023]MDO6795433.1 AarF/UbiB family protein [Shewanella sp. 1_MG-2023]
MKLFNVKQLMNHSSRSKQIITVLVKYGLANWIREENPAFIKSVFVNENGQQLASLSVAVRLRLAFSELGTAFIKLGQILSTRADLVGQDIAEELTKLQAGTPADPEAEIKKTIEAEFGIPFEQLFIDFNFTPLASASVGQVHIATTQDGDEVVVKVQHAGIEDKILADVEILKMLASLVEQYHEELRLYQPTSLILEFTKSLLNELDYVKEARSMQKASQFFEANPHVHIPDVYQQLSSKRVLVMERLKGFSIADKTALEQGQYDTSKIADVGIKVYLDMIFELGFFHADPHPGNIWVLEDNRLGVLDWGMTARLSKDMQQRFQELLLALADKDPKELTYHVIRLCQSQPQLDHELLEKDISEFVHDYLEVDMKQVSIVDVLNEFIRIIKQHRLVIPTEVSMLFRVLIMLEGSSKLLSSNKSVGDAIRPYAIKIKLAQLSPLHALKQAQTISTRWQRVINGLPDEIDKLTHQISSGHFDVNLNHRNLDTIINRLVFGVLSGAIFLGGCMLLSSNVPPLYEGISILGTGITAIGSFLVGKLLLAIGRSGSLSK